MKHPIDRAQRIQTNRSRKTGHDWPDRPKQRKIIRDPRHYGTELAA